MRKKENAHKFGTKCHKVGTNSTKAQSATNYATKKREKWQKFARTGYGVGKHAALSAKVVVLSHC